jgi:hypothetical protein
MEGDIRTLAGEFESDLPPEARARSGYEYSFALHA